MSGFRLGRVLGIELQVHPSWFVIAALVLWTMAAVALPADFPELAAPARILMAAAITLLFFASLLAHELAHSVVAVLRGIPVHRITFFLFGGMAQTSQDSRSPGEEFGIAVAGPVMSFLLAALFIALWWVGAGAGWPATVVGTAGYLGALNLVLGVFNLLPGFPMDGGRILRAALWKATGDVTRATRWASRVGVGMALLLMAFGAWRAIRGDVMAGIWLVLIGLFIRTAARAGYRQHVQSKPDRNLMFEIPEHRLPPGFAETVIETPSRPAPTRPAATIVLVRQGGKGPEVLLMRRHRSSGFVPGAWVFPGGLVDPADSGPALYERIRGLPRPPVPDASFWSAALRELYEETGVLLARTDGDAWVADASRDRRMDRLRHSLMDGSSTLVDVLEALDATLDASGAVHIAHWITPVVEPRRYDTHFFAAALPDGREATPDPREMTASEWLTPADALARFEEGSLPMVFPTVKTLESMRGYGSVEHLLDALRHRPVPPTLPRLVRTANGVGIVVDES
jgi:Zn-dependent protease/8-oxo-dGTP pyrophosphatase MutT (NUDIX family)